MKALAGMVALSLLISACGTTSAKPKPATTAKSATGPAPAKQAAPAAAQPYVIPVVLSETGPAALVGHTERSALQALQTIENRAGGIGGRPVRFRFLDDQSQPQTAVQVTQPLVSQHVPVVLGSSTVSSCKAMSALSSQGPVFYCFAPGGNQAPHSFDFAAGVPAPFQVEAVLRFFKQQGWTRIALLTTSDSSGQDGRGGVQKALSEPQNRGFTVVANEQFSPTAVSIGAQISAIAAAKPQAIIFWSAPNGAVQTAYRGITQGGLSVPVFTDSGNTIRSELLHYKEFVPARLYGSNPAFDAVTTLPAGMVSAGAKQAELQFLHAFPGNSADTGQALSWDPGRIVIRALRQVGPNATALQLRNAITSLRQFQGAMGGYDFSAVNHSGIQLADVFVCRWNSATASWEAVSGPGGGPLKPSGTK